MAQGVRDAARRLITCAAASIVAAASCAQTPPTHGASKTPTTGEASSDAAGIVDEILDKHHGSLRGTFDNTVLELREQPDAKPMKIALALPHRMRVDLPGRRVDLLVEGVGWRCVGKEPAARLEGVELQELKNLMQNLRAAMLIPLYQAKRATMAGPGVIQLVLPKGETWRLQIDESTGDPVELNGPGGAVRFLSFLQTEVTRTPNKLEFPGLGVVHATFLATDLYLKKALFTDPFVRAEAKRQARPRGAVTKAVRHTQELPRLPELQEVSERTFLARLDPGSWKERVAVIGALATTLGDRGQLCDGLPIYSIEGDGNQILVPFHPDPDGGHRPFVPGAEDVVRHEPPHRAVVVSPPPGTWDSVLADGSAMLGEFLEKQNLVRAGPLRCIPFLSPEEEPRAADLRRLLIRLEQPVADGSGR